MRDLLLLVVAVLLGFSGVATMPAATESVPAPVGPIAPALGTTEVQAVSPPPVSPSLPAHLPWNLTWAPHAVPAAPAPVSAVLAEPSPPIPPTTPIVLTLLTSSRNTTLSENYSAPNGTWARIVLNYTGAAVNGVYDSSYRAYIDRSLVLFGTTPEYGTWTVQQDLTEYSVLFHGIFNLTYLLGAAVTSGYFLTSLSLSFYPVPAGSSPPVEPSQIIPLWYRQVFSTASPTVSESTDLPTNVVNATVELFLYGFGPDEFWYSSSPGYRDVQLSANGTEFASVLPFPYVNTGGIDLFTWRPIPAAFTLDDRPFRLNVTAALGLLEGPRNLTAHLGGLPSGATWILGGSLLLTRAVNTSAATLTSYALTAPAPTITTDGHSYYDETATVSLHYSSLVGLPGGAANVSAWTNQSYSSSTAFGQSWLGATWSNLSADERSLTTESTLAPSGTFAEVHAYDFPIAMSIGTAFVETSSNNGSYPIYGNFTDYLNYVHQEWNESLVASGPTAASSRSVEVDDRVSGGINSYAGEEELTSPNAGLLLSITFVESHTTKFYAQSAGSFDGGSAYTHLLIGAAYQPSNADQAETILANVVSAPMVERLAANVSALDVGGSVTLTAAFSGGTAPYAVTWLGLPTGCSTVDLPVLVCSPSAPGSYEISAVVTDADGSLAPVASVELSVNPLPTIALSANRSVVDLGGTVSVAAQVAGGTGALSCRWSVGAAAWSAAALCRAPFLVTPDVAGPVLVRAEVTDALGGSAFASPGLTITAYEIPTLALLPPSSSSVRVGNPVELDTVLTGGSGGVAYSWSLNGSALAGFNGSTYTFVPVAPGNYSFSVTMVDAGGGAATSGTITVEVTPAPAPSGGGGGAASALPGGLDWYAFVALGVAAGLVAGIALMALFPRRRGPPPAPARAVRPAQGRRGNQ